MAGHGSRAACHQTNEPSAKPLLLHSKPTPLYSPSPPLALLLTSPNNPSSCGRTHMFLLAMHTAQLYADSHTFSEGHWQRRLFNVAALFTWDAHAAVRDAECVAVFGHR
ncbi:hypothetical protein KC19_12G150000 [Ceratodon purpureus]|uniref:Uncharacterized protein n=1 Tax=Ceratodon purpureus TaxID=3225 RepID=A0A8T0G8R3_CERPU|nr:hypothetical protein KC19_12G150000 [Ceratodon purpureus]